MPALFSTSPNSAIYSQQENSLRLKRRINAIESAHINMKAFSILNCQPHKSQKESLQLFLKVRAAGESRASGSQLPLGDCLQQGQKEVLFARKVKIDSPFP